MVRGNVERKCKLGAYFVDINKQTGTSLFTGCKYDGSSIL